MQALKKIEPGQEPQRLAVTTFGVGAAPYAGAQAERAFAESLAYVNDPRIVTDGMTQDIQPGPSGVVSTVGTGGDAASRQPRRPPLGGRFPHQVARRMPSSPGTAAPAGLVDARIWRAARRAEWYALRAVAQALRCVVRRVARGRGASSRLGFHACCCVHSGRQRLLPSRDTSVGENKT